MAESREVRIGQERVYLVLSDVHDGSSTRSPSSSLDSFHARLVLPHLTAEARVWLTDTNLESPLDTFFADLASDWRGWEGAKEWSAYEGGLSLSCSHDRLGHVRVAVGLREYAGSGWLVRGDVSLDAGQLDAVARQLASFVR